MQTLILTLHVIVCVTLVILVLLQAGKEGMGVIFGGGNASVFGSTGAGGLLAKLTAFMAVLFVITSLTYNYTSSSRLKQESTILDVRLEDAPTAPAKAAPAGTTAAPAAAPAAPAATP
ncbi:MAG: preprotein translocase subunit SecG, partial [Bilophila sp.]